MSLVNDMLRDLDQRQRQPQTGRIAPQRHHNRVNKFLVVACFVMLTLLGFFFVQSPSLVGEFTSFFNTEAPAPEVTSSAAEFPKERDKPSDRSDQKQSEQPKPEKRIRVINWLASGTDSGNLTFWLDNITPYVIHKKSPTLLDIELRDTALQAELPRDLGRFISGFDRVNGASGSRFRLYTSDNVEFQIKLKRDPARLQVGITRAEQPEQRNTRIAQSRSSSVSKDVDPVGGKHTAQSTKKAGKAATKIHKHVQRRVTDASVVRDAKRLLGQGKADIAQARLQNYIQTHPRALQSRYLLSKMYLAQRDYRALAQQLEQAPRNLSWALLRVRAELEQGRATVALQWLKAYPEGKTRADYLELLAIAHQQAGHHQQAVDQFVKLLELQAHNGRAWLNMGVSLEHLNNRVKAQDAYQNALKVPALDAAARVFATQRLQQLAAKK